MAENQRNNQNIPTKVFRENRAITALLLISGFLLIFIGRIWVGKASVLDICSGGGEIAIASGQTRKAKIRPDCWSEFSAALNKDIAVIGENGKYFEICFWSRKLEKCAKRPELLRKSRWFGDIRASSFRIRGEEGFVAITVSR